MGNRMSISKPKLQRVGSGLLVALLVSSTAGAAYAQPSAQRAEQDAGFARALPTRANQDDEVTRAYERALAVYEDEVRDFQATVGQIINAEYRSRRARVDVYFQTEIEALRVEERALRGRAIEEFEQFLSRFPDHPHHSPDVLFRLAELHYEKTEDDFILADIAYEEQRRQYDLGLIPELPEEAEKDFSKSIELFELLVTKFPDYRQVDGAWYLLAICHLQMYDNHLAIDALKTLVYNYPDSGFAQEGYLRLGEEYFLDQNFRLARPAYERALQYGESVWYDKILFKLGWANYLLNEYDSAIKNFVMLLEYYEDGAEGSDQAVREEALEYFAIVLGEQDWDLDGETDKAFVLPRALEYLGTDRPYTIEVLDRLATLLSEYAEGGGADFYSAAQTDVLRHIIDRYPLDAKNAERHNEIITALFRANHIKEALAEGDEFNARYSMGGPWYSEQERMGNFEEIAYAERTSRVLLIEAGTILYNEAEALAHRAMLEKDQALAADARTRYTGSAAAYGQFLERYPNDAEAYEVLMFRAQALLNAGNVLEAADAFSLVRESQLSTQYRDAAAGLAIDAYGDALMQAIDRKELEFRAYPPYTSLRDVPAEQRKEAKEAAELRGAPANEPIPELSLRWVEAIDRFIELELHNEDDPEAQGQLAFAAARLFYDYRHHETAIERLTAIVRNYCGQQETGYAAALLLETYRVREDYAQVEFWTNEIERLGACVQVPPELVAAFQADLERFRMGAVADQAERLYAEGKYEEAAAEYIRLTTDYADSDFAPLGLYNAGLIYEEDLRDFRLAMEQFDELIRRYPNSEYVNDSLVRVAVNSTNFFDFEKAIETYMELDRRKHSAPDQGLESPLLTAAELLRYTQQYDRAAQYYIRFANDNPRNARAPAALYTAATVYDTAGRHDDMLRTFERFRSRFGGVSNALIDGDLAVISTYIRELELARERQSSRQIDALERKVLQEFENRRPSPVPSSWANVQYVVGEILFERAKAKFVEWDAQSLGTLAKTQQTRIATRIETMPTLRDELNTVIIAGSADWTICAKYYQGLIYKRMSDRVAQMPRPNFSSFEEEDMYYGGTPDGSWIGVDAIVRQWEDQAIKDWAEDGYPIAQRAGVYNECARSMLAELHRVRPDEYPVFRTELRESVPMEFSPSSLVSPPARVEQGGARLGERPVNEGDAAPDIDLDFGGSN